jgi:hypothetical protein
MRSDYTLVHVLIPDMQMRFPGDPGCDMSFFSYAALRRRLFILKMTFRGAILYSALYSGRPMSHSSILDLVHAGDKGTVRKRVFLRIYV